MSSDNSGARPTTRSQAQAQGAPHGQAQPNPQPPPGKPGKGSRSSAGKSGAQVPVGTSPEQPAHEVATSTVPSVQVDGQNIQQVLLEVWPKAVSRSASEMCAGKGGTGNVGDDTSMILQDNMIARLALPPTWMWTAPTSNGDRGWKSFYDQCPKYKAFDAYFETYHEATQLRWNDNMAELRSKQSQSVMGLFDELVATAVAQKTASFEFDRSRHFAAKGPDVEMMNILTERMTELLVIVEKAKKLDQNIAAQPYTVLEVSYRTAFDDLLRLFLDEPAKNIVTLVERTLDCARNELFTASATVNAAEATKIFNSTFAPRYNSYAAIIEDLCNGTTLLTGASIGTTAEVFYKRYKTMCDALSKRLESNKNIWYDQSYDEELKVVHFRPIAERVSVSPKDCRCDAVSAIRVEHGLPDAVAARFVKNFSMVHITRDDKTQITLSRITAKAVDANATFVKALGRVVNPDETSDAMGLAFMDQPGAIPVTPNLPNQVDFPTPPSATSGLLVPFLVCEYKKDRLGGPFVIQGSNQMRLYFTSNIAFYRSLGLTETMMWGIYTEGKTATVECAWIDAKTGWPYILDMTTQAYDLTKPLDAFRLATFILWLRFHHAPLLKEKLAKITGSMWQTTADGAERKEANRFRWKMAQQQPDVPKDPKNPKAPGGKKKKPTPANSDNLSVP